MRESRYYVAIRKPSHCIAFLRWGLPSPQGAQQMVTIGIPLPPLSLFRPSFLLRPSAAQDQADSFAKATSSHLLASLSCVTPGACPLHLFLRSIFSGILASRMSLLFQIVFLFRPTFPRMDRVSTSLFTRSDDNPRLFIPKEQISPRLDYLLVATLGFSPPVEIKALLTSLPSSGW